MGENKSKSMAVTIHLMQMIPLTGDTRALYLFEDKNVWMLISVFETREYGTALEIIYCGWVFFSPLSSSLRGAWECTARRYPLGIYRFCVSSSAHLQRLLEHEQRSRSDVDKIQLERTSEGATPKLCDQQHQKFFKVRPYMSYAKKSMRFLRLN